MERIATREVEPELQELWDKGIKTYSISKLNAINQCQYQAWLNYEKKVEQEKRQKSIYGIMGTVCHDRIEEFCHGEATLKDIEAAIQEEMDMMDLLGIQFPKGRNGSSSIKDNWLENMYRFSKEFKLPVEPGESELNIDTEKLMLYKLDDEHYLMGYADAIRNNSDGTVTLIDWKTSRDFDKSHVIEAGRQLVVYKLALEAAGVKVRECQWCMLKYCETTWTLKSGKQKSKVSEWRNLIKDLQKQIEKSLKDLGYDEVDIDIIIQKGLKDNSWDVFPEEIRNKYDTHVYYRTYNITDEVIEETLRYIKDSINQYESLGDEENWKPCNIDKESFFCYNLCDFGGKSGLCKYYVDYLNKFSKDDDDLSKLF